MCRRQRQWCAMSGIGSGGSRGGSIVGVVCTGEALSYIDTTLFELVDLCLSLLSHRLSLH